MRFEQAMELLAALEREDVGYVLVGSMAMAVQGLVRATPVIRYGPPDANFIIDFIARLGEAFEFDAIEWEDKVVEGIRVRTATPRMLYEMKRDTVRPQDRIDAQKLREHFGLKDES